MTLMVILFGFLFLLLFNSSTSIPFSHTLHCTGLVDDFLVERLLLWPNHWRHFNFDNTGSPASYSKWLQYITSARDYCLYCYDCWMLCTLLLLSRSAVLPFVLPLPSLATVAGGAAAAAACRLCHKCCFGCFFLLSAAAIAIVIVCIYFCWFCILFDINASS